VNRDTFYLYKRGRYLVVSALALLIMSLIYCFDRPLGGPSGATTLGIVYGVIAALGIVYLMWYGIRKRSYYAKNTTLKACLSAHVWIGISLIVIVPLHCGFSFGNNVHTLAYVLMLVVVLSGIWGAISFASLAPDIRAHRGGGSIKKLLEQVYLLNSEIDDLVRGKSDRFLDLKNKIDFKYKPSVLACLFGKRTAVLEATQVAQNLQYLNEDENPSALKLVGLANKKRELVASIQSEISILARLKIWLYVHVPVTFALFATLLIHIFVVLYYW
jgi:hypothetical protein